MNGPRFKGGGPSSSHFPTGVVSGQMLRAARTGATGKFKERLNPLLASLSEDHVSLLDYKTVTGIVQNWLRRSTKNPYISKKIRESADYRNAVYSLLDGLKALSADMSEEDVSLLDQDDIKDSIVRHVSFVVEKSRSRTSTLPEPLPPPKTTTAISPAEIVAAAGFLDRSPEELRQALERAADLKAKGLLISLPDKIPDERKFANREDKAETIIGFLRREWGKEMKAGLLTRKKLRVLDPSAAAAIDYFLTKKPAPPDIVVPTLQELNDAKLRNVAWVREANRLMSARTRRFKAHNP